VVVVFEFGPPIRVFEAASEVRWARHRGGFVAGIGDEFTVTEHAGFQAGLQLNLTPLGARLLFGLPLDALARRVVSFDDVLPKEQRRLAERLGNMPSWDIRFRALERFLLDRLSGVPSQVAPAAWAVRRILAAGGAIDIGQVADELGYSHKHMITLFRDGVGVRPKLFAGIVRFDRVVHRLRARDSCSWAELALAMGYADQAHLAREIRRFSGFSPTELRAAVADDPVTELTAEE
jgi:AraC-like DNA-binding protein